MWNKVIPDEKACLEILRKAGCSQEVIAHALFVKEVALRIVAKCKEPVDVELLVAGALLHDIGRAITHSVAHGVKGGEIARKFGLDERLVRIIERHVGGGITEEEAVALGLGNKSLLPETLEEKIVCIADKMVAHDKIGGIEAEIKRLREKGLYAAADRVLQLYKEVVKLCGELEL